MSFAAEHEEELKQFVRDLAVIPAPSGDEGRRAAFIRDTLESWGARGVFIDEALNVVWPRGEGEERSVFMAHTDVVFPDTEPLPFSEDGDVFRAPGVGDDTANLAVLLFAARSFMGRTPKKPLLIVANSCEEGLGNLKGCRRIIDTYKVRELVTVDGDLDTLVTGAVGSHRYRVTVRTAGGHSFHDFGAPNAAAQLAEIICALYAVRVPEKEGAVTTYNVGTIEGGTSVNTIAQEAEMLYEYRSDDAECLAAMRGIFLGIIGDFRARGMEIEAELIGERPCSGAVDPAEHERLKEVMRRAAAETTGLTLRESVGSTDANYPLSLGIPAVCIGGCDSEGSHTREETLDASTLRPGLEYVIKVLGNWF